MNKMFKWLLLVNLIFLLCGCTTSLGHIKTLTTKGEASGRKVAALKKPTVGSSDRYGVFIISAGTPSIEEAVNTALLNYDGDYLEDVDITNTSFFIPYLYSYNNITVKGTVVKSVNAIGVDKLIEKWKNGNIYSERKYLNGLLEGESIFYNENSKLAMKQSFKEGKKSGITLIYYENGQIKYSGEYKEDNLDGETIQYYPKGGIKVKAKMKAGKKEGEGSVYYENGQVELKENFSDDKRNGESTSFYESGKIKERTNYKDDYIIDGIGYFETGEVFSKSNYNGILGKLNVIEYFKTGAERLKYSKVYAKNFNGEFVGYILDGELIEYNEQGKEIKKETYSVGKKTE